MKKKKDTGWDLEWIINVCFWYNLCDTRIHRKLLPAEIKRSWETNIYQSMWFENLTQLSSRHALFSLKTASFHQWRPIGPSGLWVHQQRLYWQNKKTLHVTEPNGVIITIILTEAKVYTYLSSSFILRSSSISSSSSLWRRSISSSRADSSE